MSWKRLIIIAASAVVIYYMAKFTLAHLKDDGMVWWGGWIAVGLFVAAALIIMHQLKAVTFQARVLNQIAFVARVFVLVGTIIFVWEALARGIPLSPNTLPAPSQLWAEF